MSGIEPFQFEPVYQPGEEPPQEESVGQEVEAHEEDNTSRMGNTEWCAALVRLCRWQMNSTAAKN